MFTLCCSKWAVIQVDTHQWLDSCPDTPKTITISFYLNHADAIAALGAYSFTSTSNTSFVACLNNLVVQINAAALAHAGSNPEGTSPASFVGGVFYMTSFPVATPYACDAPACNCGETLAVWVTCNQECLNIPDPFSNGAGASDAVLIPCYGPPTIEGNPFVCTGNQNSVTIVFPGGIPPTYTLTIPTGWTLVSTVVAAYDTLLVTVIPDSTSGIITVSYLNSILQTYTATFQLVNDCFIGNCASNMLLSRFCNDIDPCCISCNEYEVAERKIERDNMNKAVALINTYSLAKQAYFINCLSSDLVYILMLVCEIKSILIRCEICPEINN